ncbi:MAG: DUF4892 domain-containing protein [Halioglobus sp.]
MTALHLGRRKIWRNRMLLGILLAVSSVVNAQTPDVLIQRLEAYPHAVSIGSAQATVLDHEVGLGALQKRSGLWRFKASERVSGVLTRHTWQIIDGFTSREVLAELVSELEGIAGARELFSCDGRSCGQSVQWANRVFAEKVLYGREELQRYRAYALEDPVSYHIQLYSAARTADRQYLHIEILAVDQPSASQSQQ